MWRKLRRLARGGVRFINEGIAPAQFKKYTTLDDHIKRFGLQKQTILLKVDIEEHEYAVFFSEHFYDSLCNVSQMLVEFHNLKDRMVDLRKIFERLTQDYLLIHVHGNNVGELFPVTGKDLKTVAFPNNIEVTLVRKEKVDPTDLLAGEVRYPIDGLDFANDPRMSDVKLEFVE